MCSPDINTQLEIIKRATAEIISDEELARKLQQVAKEKRPLRVKAGFDPTAPDIHLGHTVLLGKLRQFQDLGHTVYFLIGDFTGMIGDPSGQDKMRKRLSEEEVKQNALTYKKQVFKVLDPAKTEVVFNSSWFKAMSSTEILNLTSHATVAQILARQDFNQRYTQGRDISVLELLYPLLQAFDSVQLKADIELGGSDQKFNLLLGRELQKDFGQEPQVVIMLPLLEGTDGVQKMSKSSGNYIGIDEPAGEMFGKLMSVSDELMYRYFELLTQEGLEAVKQMHPKEAKLKLAQLITSRYHGEDAGSRERDNFEKVFSQKELPEDAPVYRIKGALSLIDVLLDSGLVDSRNEARRLIKQGGVSLEGERLDREDIRIEREGILKVGKKRFLKLIR